MALNPKRAAFVREYLIDLNGTQAAIRAGYSPRSARVTATRLLADAAIQHEVEKAQAERAKDTGLTAQMVLDGLRSIAEGEGPDAPRVRAYELLGKHLGMFTERQEVTLTGDITLDLVEPPHAGDRLT